MQNTSKYYQLFLSKNFEYFNGYNKIDFIKDGLNKTNYTSPGQTFLTIFNNLDYILETLQKSTLYVDKQIISINQFFIDKLYSISPAFTNVINEEIQCYYSSLVTQRESVRKDIKSIDNELINLNNALNDNNLYDIFFGNLIDEQESYIDSIAGENVIDSSFEDEYIEGEIEILKKLYYCQETPTSGHAYIQDKINALNLKKEELKKSNLSISEIHDLVSDYITNLITTLHTYKHYFELYFGIDNKINLKKKGIAYFQTIFNICFDVPTHHVFACVEDSKSIKPLSSKLPKEKIIESLNTLKADKKIFHITEYEITSLKDLFGIYFYFFIQETIWIKKCKNCGKYFIPTNRSDEKYCDNISPQKPDKTCKQYAVKKTYTDSIASDPIKNAQSHVSNSYMVKRTRAKQKNDLRMINKINKILDKFKNNYDKQLKKYEKKLLSEEEFVQWIYSQKKDVQ